MSSLAESAELVGSTKAPKAAAAAPDIARRADPPRVGVAAVSSVIRIGIADDHAIVRSALRHWLLAHPDLCVTGEASDGFQALELVARHTPDVLLLDLSMPGRDGLDIIASLRAKAPQMAILVFSGHPEALYARKLLKDGVHGFVHKSSDPTQLVTAIRRVAEGHRYVSEKLANQFAEDLRACQLPPHEHLTSREFQVLLLLATGNKAGAIAKKLNLSISTITMYRSRLFQKLDLSTNSHLTHFAIKHGLLD